MTWILGMTLNIRSVGACSLASRRLQALLAAVPMIVALPVMADDGANPRRNIVRAIRQIEAVTAERVVNPRQTELDDNPKVSCIENRFCEGRIGELHIEAMGRQIEITPAPKTLPEHLVGSCIGLLRAFAPNASVRDARTAVHLALEKVLDGSVATFETEAFEFEMKLNAEDLPCCKLVRFVQR